MVSKKFIIGSEHGLHMRPAQRMVRTASAYASKTTIKHNGKAVSADSILSIMSACIRQGDEIIVECIGADEQSALAAVTELITSELGGEKKCNY